MSVANYNFRILTDVIAALSAEINILKEKYKIKVSRKANSELGIPLNILGFKGRNYSLIDWLWVVPMALVKLLFNWEKYDVYVVEMGVDSPKRPKNMEYLLTIVRPQIGVFINALAVHSEEFNMLPGKVVDQIANEKGKLITSLPETGTAVLNANDKRVLRFNNKTKAKVIEFDKLSVNIPSQVMDGHYQEIFAGAVAVGGVFQIEKTKAINNLKKNFKLPPGRMTKISGIKGTIILDSSYNASGKPMVAALETLTKVARGKKIAVIGDMRELGKQAKREHEIVAREIIGKVDELVLIGPLMKKYLEPEVLRLGFNKNKIHWYADAYQALEALEVSIVQGEETILIKGSQNTMFLEIIVEGLMKDKDMAKKLLCRRGKFWDKKRKLLQSKV